MDSASGKVEPIFQRVLYGRLTLEKAADELELEALLWARGLHYEILHQWSLKGIPSKDFESLAKTQAVECARFAADHFFVICQPNASARHTPVLVGQNPAVIESSSAPEINNRNRLLNRILEELRHYPQEYERENRFRQQVVKRIADPPWPPTDSDPRAISDTEAVTTVALPTRTKAQKGDATLLEGQTVVTFRTAQRYLGIGERQRQNLVKRGVLDVTGGGQNRKVTVTSLKKYRPTEKPH